jgi:hypothetical protein
VKIFFHEENSLSMKAWTFTKSKSNIYEIKKSSAYKINAKANKIGEDRNYLFILGYLKLL